MARTLYKPPGLSVFPRHGQPGSDCLLARLLSEDPGRGSIDWPEGFAGGIAHRLDIPTSGAVWVADDPAELARMRALFAGGALRKTYRFVAARDVPWQDNRIDRAIAHARGRKNRMVVQRGASTPHRGKWYPARTSVRRVHGDLWAAVIETGVMHQIRVHAAFMGLPLAGDRLYGGGEPPAQAPPGASFLLHHMGLEGGGMRTEPVEAPGWVSG